MSYELKTSNTYDNCKLQSPEIIVLYGTSISHCEDVAIALKLGTQGVIAASSIMKAKNPYGILREFAESAKQRTIN